MQFKYVSTMSNIWLHCAGKQKKLIYLWMLGFAGSCVRVMTYVWETWLMCERHDSCVGDMTHVWENALTFERHDSCVRKRAHVWETWLVCERHDSHVRDMTHVSETWLMCQRHDSCVRDMTHVSETLHMRESHEPLCCVENDEFVRRYWGSRGFYCVLLSTKVALRYALQIQFIDVLYRYGVTKTRMPYLIDHFPQISH